MLRIERFNAVGVALLIAQACQTIVQATLGYAYNEEVNAVGIMPIFQ